MLILLVAASIGVLLLGMAVGYILSRPHHTTPNPSPQDFSGQQNIYSDEMLSQDGQLIPPVDLDPDVVEEAKRILDSVVSPLLGSRLGVFGILGRLPAAFQQTSALLNRLSPAERQALGHAMKAYAEGLQLRDPKRMQPIIEIFAGLTGPDMANRPTFDASVLMQSMADERRQQSAFSTPMAFGVLALFVAGVSGAIAFRTGDVLPYLQSKDWAETSGEIVSNDVQTFEERDDDGTIEDKYRINITYRYQVDDQAYTSKRIWFNFDDATRLDSAIFVDNLVEDYPAGRQVRVYYDPDDPNAAVLERRLRPGMAHYFGGFCGGLAVLLIFVIAPIIFMKRLIFGGVGASS